MSQVQELEKRFGVPGCVRVDLGRGGLPRVFIRTDLAAAQIYLHGAHVAHFQPSRASPLLFLSGSSEFDERKPIRGGVPLVFPWFGPQASQPELPAHGFARVRSWQIESCDLRADGSVRLVLTLAADAETLRLWPHEFLARLIVIVATTLDMTLEIRNASPSAFQFEEALHAYLAVGNIRSVTVEGLEGSPFVDKVDGGQRKDAGGEAIHFTGETDRVYQPTTGNVLVRDPSLDRTILVEKENSQATVVWNPWIGRARALADFGDDEWTSMLCIEPANAKDSAVQLAAGQTHRMRARFGLAK